MKKILLIGLAAFSLSFPSKAFATAQDFSEPQHGCGDALNYSTFEPSISQHDTWAYTQTCNDNYGHLVSNQIWMDNQGDLLTNVLENPLMFSSSARDALALKVDATQTVGGHTLGSPVVLVAVDISDSTTVGQNVMKAASQSAARTAIGATNFSGSYLDLTNLPAGPSFSSATFGGSTTAALLSTTRAADVTYAYDANITISLLGGQSVTAVLTYADNSGMSTNPVVVDSSAVASSGLAGLNQTQTLKLSGAIPAGKYRQVTFVTAKTGTATLPSAPSTLKAGQEVLR